MIRRDVPPEGVVPLARDLAPLVDELWLVEDLGWAGGIAQVAAVLTATADVRVGHGVAPAPFRNPAALAMEWGALARAHPGRLHAGLGHGVPEWMDRVGGSPHSRLGLLREVASAARRLLAGDTVTVTGDDIHLEEVALVFLPAVPPPVSLGVSGPRSLRLSGEVADGTVLAEGTGPATLRVAREAIDAGRAAAGVEAAHRVTVFVAYWCGDPAAAPPAPELVGEGWTATGSTPADVADRLRDLVAAGADALVLVPFGDDLAGHVDQVATAAREVMPLVRR
jgi:alkanesulfonate monooxygenase SsuD/methylene tetrahydromethanopterin reductase-like flavin-dependent oxidoreductase (luciferase family)